MDIPMPDPVTLDTEGFWLFCNHLRIGCLLWTDFNVPPFPDLFLSFPAPVPIQRDFLWSFQPVFGLIYLASAD
ncbi:hypothetical protein CHARACLAT_013842 [Characodon lateralis]|uniref:Uncharacterized protein n=2 Tax=Goodeidae TaxID=28758 RepID=A0ABU7CXI4_9TELE|nr:hypothetical protein [Characodon lateralis]